MVCKRSKKERTKSKRASKSWRNRSNRDFLEPSDMSGNNMLNHKDCLAMDNKRQKDPVNG